MKMLSLVEICHSKTAENQAAVRSLDHNSGRARKLVGRAEANQLSSIISINSYKSQLSCAVTYMSFHPPSYCGIPGRVKHLCFHGK